MTTLDTRRILTAQQARIIVHILLIIIAVVIPTTSITGCGSTTPEELSQMRKGQDLFAKGTFMDVLVFKEGLGVNDGTPYALFPTQFNPNKLNSFRMICVQVYQGNYSLGPCMLGTHKDFKDADRIIQYGSDEWFELFNSFRLFPQ